MDPWLVPSFVFIRYSVPENRSGEGTRERSEDRRRRSPKEKALSFQSCCRRLSNSRFRPFPHPLVLKPREVDHGVSAETSDGTSRIYSRTPSSVFGEDQTWIRCNTARFQPLNIEVTRHETALAVRNGTLPSSTARLDPSSKRTTPSKGFSKVTLSLSRMSSSLFL